MKRGSRTPRAKADVVTAPASPRKLGGKRTTSAAAGQLDGWEGAQSKRRGCAVSGGERG